MKTCTSDLAIVALAGRRIDAAGAETVRFPLAVMPNVRQRLRNFFRQENASVLVCSAACGADLLALDEASRLGIRRRVVLPYCREQFRESSVIDRPGEWGPMFDRITEEAERRGDLIVLGLAGEDGAFAITNEAIIHEAQRLGRVMGIGGRLIAGIIWEGSPKGAGDVTEQFRQFAVAAGFEERLIRTQ